VAPKVYARFNNISLARLMSGPLVLLAWGFSPISSIMVRWTKALEKNIHDRTSSKITTSREDIDEAIELTVRNEQGAKQEMDILKSIIKFGDVTVKQIMRSRVDVIAVDFRVSYSDLIQTVKESGFSRIPVFDNDFDNITGVLYAKDLLEFINEEEKFEWQALIRTDVFYVPEAKKINELLKEFQERKQHMAIVVDEYGGCSGIVTLEDIMEEVIGDIKDEFDDDEELEYKKLDENNFIFEGKTLLNDLCRVIGVDTTTFDELRGDSDSIAGLILETTGQIPELETELEILNFKMKVIATNKRRIEKVKITILPLSSTTIEES
jgi:putative hemolysin